MLIVTHHDDEHIKGIIDLLERVVIGEYGNKNDFIKKVVFNSPRKILGTGMLFWNSIFF